MCIALRVNYLWVFVRFVRCSVYLWLMFVQWRHVTKSGRVIVDLCLCPFFNKQRHCRLPVKLSTVEYRRRVDVLNEWWIKLRVTSATIAKTIICAWYCTCRPSCLLNTQGTRDGEVVKSASRKRRTNTKLRPIFNQLTYRNGPLRSSQTLDRSKLQRSRNTQARRTPGLVQEGGLSWEETKHYPKQWQRIKTIHKNTTIPDSKIIWFIIFCGY